MPIGLKNTYFLFSVRVNQVSIDHAGEFYASCSNDGRVVVTGLYTGIIFVIIIRASVVVLIFDSKTIWGSNHYPYDSHANFSLVI